MPEGAALRSVAGISFVACCPAAAPEVGRRLADYLCEDPVEVSHRLKSNVISNFTHAQLRVEQKVLGVFDTYHGKGGE